MEESYKIVEFENWCWQCEYVHDDDYDGPCNECLHHPTNLYSKVPVNFKVKKDARKE